jgi:hypothetical protein
MAEVMALRLARAEAGTVTGVVAEEGGGPEGPATAGWWTTG